MEKQKGLTGLVLGMIIASAAALTLASGCGHYRVSHRRSHQCSCRRWTRGNRHWRNRPFNNGPYAHRNLGRYGHIKGCPHYFPR